MTPPAISALDLALSATLLLLNAGLSLLLGLGIARSLLIAALRTVVQLLLVGMVLKTVFALKSPWLIGAVVLFMGVSAAIEINARQQRRLRGAWSFGIGAGTATLAAVLAASLGVSLLGAQPWWEPHVVIPMAGIVLGNVMNGVSVTLNAFTSGLTRERAAIEAQLELGATRLQALSGLLQSAIKSGMIPIVNQMSAAGIITLPGMMTGQILAGMLPLEAAKYQILVLLLLAGGAGLGAIGAAYAALWRVTDERDRLRLDWLAPHQPE